VKSRAWAGWSPPRRTEPSPPGRPGCRGDLHRDGGLLATADDTGTYTDALGKPRRGTIVTSQVCDAGSDTCSAPHGGRGGSGGLASTAPDISGGPSDDDDPESTDDGFESTDDGWGPMWHGPSHVELR
jgi:hypothetical protein